MCEKNYGNVWLWHVIGLIYVWESHVGVIWQEVSHIHDIHMCEMEGGDFLGVMDGRDSNLISFWIDNWMDMIRLVEFMVMIKY